MSARIRNLSARYGRKSDLLEIAKEIIEENQRHGEPDDLALEEYRASAYPIKVTTENETYYQYKKYPIVTADEQFLVMEWGLIPFWSRNYTEVDRIRRATVNARAETLFEKSSFREPIQYRRCIVPSTGYFEYHYPKTKTKGDPYFIFLENQTIFSMAGIYDTWTDKITGQVIMTFSIVTTPGNKLTNKIHNGKKNPFRMPLILHPDQEDLWLNKSMELKKDIQELLVTFPDTNMNAYPIVKDHFLHSNIHSQDIIEPDPKIPNVLHIQELF